MMTKDYLTYIIGPPKLHESPVKHHFISGSWKCSTKQLSSLLTKILSYKDWTRKYITIKTSHTEVNDIDLQWYGFWTSYSSVEKPNKNNASKSVLFLLFLGPIHPCFLCHEPFDDTGTVKVSQYFNQLIFDARQIRIIPHSWMPAAKEHGFTVVCRVPFKLWVPSNCMKYCVCLCSTSWPHCYSR